MEREVEPPKKCPRCGEKRKTWFSGYGCDNCGWPLEMSPDSFGALRLAASKKKAKKT